MKSKLITHLSWVKLTTNFSDIYEDFSVSTVKSCFWSNTFTTKVMYNLLNFDPESSKDHILLSIQAKSLAEALANHIALSKLVLKEEPINWNQRLIEENKPRHLLKPIGIKNYRFFDNFKSNYSKAILAINSMNPSTK